MANDAELKQNFGNKAIDNAFKLLYHVGITIYGYLVIMNTVCHHTMIGGTQDDRQLLMAF